MTLCDLKDSCITYREGIKGHIALTEYIRLKYCCGDYRQCTWYINCKGLWGDKASGTRPVES